jgi:PhzF family phenazine biosynthesis protein
MYFLLIDAFASRPFTGNPAAVVLVEDSLPDQQLQAIAMEFNQAETVFVRALDDGRWELRWFTPTREVPLCGHATLASAQALREWKMHKGEKPIRFVTRDSGELTCRFVDDLIAMDFPATPPQPAPLPPEAAKVLGLNGPLDCVGTTPMNLTIVVADESQVRWARPDLRTLASWHPTGVTITAPGSDVDFVSRFFAPQSGIDEDPVTGSAHCTLAVYWAKQLGKKVFTARQLSKRGGELGVTLNGDRVELRGTAITTMRGQIL